MEFIVELLKEIAKAIVREISAHLFKKQFLNEDNEKSTLDRGKLIGWIFKKEKLI
ncbi:hypothetical protein ACT7C3_27310 [Bacillus pacificus]